ncbi:MULTISPECIES: hypothetical protein [Streptomyces]|uniref:hypothetical protein n=1 Tax=Streptomyces TaxID=1883 RepID=UPI0004CDB919|nr:MULTISPECIES: hypothetical protein [Streptomyces]
MGQTDNKAHLWQLDLPTPDEAMARICHTVARDLTGQERLTYLSGHVSVGRGPPGGVPAVTPVGPLKAR